MLVTQALDGAEESEIVKALLRLRRTLDDQQAGEQRSAEVEAAQAQVVNLVNTFFHDRLVAMPTIDEYIRTVQAASSGCAAAPAAQHGAGLRDAPRERRVAAVVARVPIVDRCGESAHVAADARR